MADAADQDLVQVTETGEILEAELIALKLREAGIDAQILDQTFHQEPLPNVRAFSVVRIMVPAAQEAAARRELSRDVSLPPDVEINQGSADEGEES